LFRAGSWRNFELSIREVGKRGEQAVYEKILAAVDDSQIAERVLAAAQELATLANGEVHVLHVWEPEPSRNIACTMPSCEDAHVMVERAAESLTAAGVRATGEVAANLHSRSAFEITRYARSHEIGVIVIGSQGRGDVSALLLGSTAHKVVHMTDRPVVIVP
jgi:nucleotide-binding universal stress UspA family protein